MDIKYIGTWYFLNYFCVNRT